MSEVATNTITLGPAWSGVAIEIQLVDTAGTNSGSPTTTGLVNINSAQGVWQFTHTYTTGFQGGGKVQKVSDHSFIAAFAYNPPGTVDVTLSEEDIASIAEQVAATIGATGSGQYPIDHDGGSGAADAPATVNGVASATDCLRFVSLALPGGVPDLDVTAYLASEYAASPPVRTSRGTTKTGSDGRWAAPLNLDSGTYVIVADNAGDGYQAEAIDLVIP